MYKKTGHLSTTVNWYAISDQLLSKNSEFINKFQKNEKYSNNVSIVSIFF